MMRRMIMFGVVLAVFVAAAQSCIRSPVTPDIPTDPTQEPGEDTLSVMAAGQEVVVSGFSVAD